MRKLIGVVFVIRALLISIMIFIVVGMIIGASPTLVSDWIFRTGQELIRTYNSSSQLIETVDNRNKARRQYGALTVDGMLYANGAVSATGALITKGNGSSNGIFIGTDAQLYRSAADVLTTPDSIIGQATQTIYENVIIGNSAVKKTIYNNSTNYDVKHAASYSSQGTNYTGMMKVTFPHAANSMLTMYDVHLFGYSYGFGRWDAYCTVYFDSTNYVNVYCQITGSCPFYRIQAGVESNRLVFILGSSTTKFGYCSLAMDVSTRHTTTSSKKVSWMGDYSIATVSDISGVTNLYDIANPNNPAVNSNGLAIGTNKTTLTAGYVLDVSGAAYVSGTIYGVGTISGGTITDRSDPAEVDSLGEVNKWKVTGEEIDHESLGDCAVDIKELKTGFEVSDKKGKIYNSIFDRPLDATMPYTWGIKDEIDKVKQGIETVRADVSVKVVTAVVESKGRNISKTISTLSRAIQQLSERLDKLEGR